MKQSSNGSLRPIIVDSFLNAARRNPLILVNHHRIINIGIFHISYIKYLMSYLLKIWRFSYRWCGSCGRTPCTKKIKKKKKSKWKLGHAPVLCPSCLKNRVRVVVVFFGCFNNQVEINHLNEFFMIWVIDIQIRFEKMPSIRMRMSFCLRDIQWNSFRFLFSYISNNCV